MNEVKEATRIGSAIEQIDDVLHQKARLAIMASLMAAGELDFGALKRNLSLSDGNLSTHLAVLERNGFVLIRKEFVLRKPLTTIVPTEKGRYAFERYVEALEAVLQSMKEAKG